MRKALLPALSILLLVITGTWGYHAVIGFGGREGDNTVEDEELVGLVRDLPEGTDGEGGDGAPPGSGEGEGPSPDGDSSTGKRGTTSEAGLVEEPPEEDVDAPDPWVPGDEAPPEATERAVASREWLLHGSGAGSVDEEAWIPPGIGWIGTPLAWAEETASRLDPGPAKGILSEAPRHAVELPEGLWIERYEVTEERYRTFLEQTAMVEFTTPLGDAENLLETIAELFIEPTPAVSDAADVAARQLYRANQGVLDPALRGRRAGESSLDATQDERLWGKMRSAPLPRGLKLRFYDRAPPSYWPSERYEPGHAQHPVRELSFGAANALAMWAGKHLPSEITWELAARGPEGWDYPWGNNASLFATRVNGGTPRPRGEEAETLPVTSAPEGASWVGCRHILGNVAEWTRSWPFPYAESDGTASGIGSGGTPRGGSAANRHRVWVRTALRGHAMDYARGEDELHPARTWIGARLARHRDPARSLAYGMQAEAQLAGWLLLDPTILEPRVYAGVEGMLERRILEPRQDASVRMGAKAFVVQPLASVSHQAKGDGHLRWYAAGVPEAVTDLDALVAMSAEAPVLLGLFHNGVRLLGTYEIRDGSRPAGGRLRLQAADTQPGSRWICLWQGYLALWAPERQDNPRLGIGADWRILTRRPVTPAIVNVSARRMRGDQLPSTKAGLLLHTTGQVDCDLESRLGNPANPDLVVRVRFQVQAEPKVVESVPTWTPGHLK